MDKIAKKFTDIYLKIKNDDKEEFKIVFQNMIQRGFIVKQRSENDYNFIMSNEELFKLFFEIIGFTFHAEYRIETFYIKSENNSFLKNTKKNETIILLVLRLLYEEEVIKITLNNYIEINYDRLEQKLLEINFDEVTRDRINITAVLEPLKTFRDHNIINFISSKFSHETIIRIYPSIEVVFNFEDLDNIINRLNVITGEVDIDEVNEG